MHRLLEHGPLRYGELEEKVHGITGKVLSESLTDLEKKELIERTVVDTKPLQVEYSLTHHGRGLEEAVDELHRWGREYLREAPDSEKSII